MFEVTKFADSSCVARTVGVLTVSAHLTSSYAVIAFVALAFRVEWLICMSAVRYLSFAYLHSFLLCYVVLGSFDLFYGAFICVAGISSFDL